MINNFNFFKSVCDIENIVLTKAYNEAVAFLVYVTYAVQE